MNIKFDELCTYLYSHKKKSWLKLSKPQEAFLYKSTYRINLLNQEKDEYKIKKFLKKIDKKKIFNEKKYCIYHLFYELGNFLIGIATKAEDILAIEVHYTKIEEVQLPQPPDNSIRLHEVSSPDKESYLSHIEKIHKEIRSGEFYQLNYTKKWTYQFFQTLPLFLTKFFSSQKKLASLAHVTIIPSIKKMWISNTPECLFIAKKSGNTYYIDTYPIKGTSLLSQGIDIAKKTLLNSKKDLAELDMITDLMRNDLNKLQLPKAKVVKRRFLFTVPNLLQQASWVRGEYSKKLRLGELVSAIFPGGSITGAPKISTMKEIYNLEVESRSFYCGSTIYHSSKNCSASINIRSATVELSDKTLSIAAGGAITLLSQAEDEWQEMLAKKDSLLNIWE